MLKGERFSYLKTATGSLIVPLKENQFPAPNKLLLTLVCSVIGKKQAGDYKTGEKQIGSQHVIVMGTNCSCS